MLPPTTPLPRRRPSPRRHLNPLMAGRGGMALLLLGLLLGATVGIAAEDDAAGFESRIRPILVKRCEQCHGEQGDPGGGLRLDTRMGWMEGGASGPAIVPGDVEGSVLVQAVRWDDPDLRMPPEDAGGKLSAAEIAILEAWVAGGAHDPRSGGAAAAARRWDELLAERMEWWSLKPVPPLPAGGPTVALAAEIDRHLEEALRQAGLEFGPQASAETLLRRLFLILTGLPPTKDDCRKFRDAWGRDPEGAYAGVVEELLASPAYGERFARHWLDVVRFSETHGNEWNYDVPSAWRYRDWCVRAFNDDLPYDQFVREQIAGDLIASPRRRPLDGSNESVIGTAFHRFGEVNHDSCVQFAAIGYDLVDNQVDTLTRAFQAMTVSCARCHDHKMDAVSARDYHALLGVLRSSRSVQHSLDPPTANAAPIEQLTGIKQRIRAELAEVWRQDVAAIDGLRLAALATREPLPPADGVLAAWAAAATTEGPPWPEAWQAAVASRERLRGERQAANATKELIADFRKGLPLGWTTDGQGLRGGSNSPGEFVVAESGAAAVRQVLPAGLATFAISAKLNGAARSPTLSRSRSRISFEVTGNRFSLARLVFNNCQLNYNHQHSIHHDDWSWVTIDFEEGTDRLLPYAELLTYRDNPKFPDPLGTLGKDTENQRGPYAEHASDPRSWWGVRRIVAHDGNPPADELEWLKRLDDGPPPATPDEGAGRFAAIATAAVAAFASHTATDDDVRWLSFLLAQGFLSNRNDASLLLAELVADYRRIDEQLSIPTTMPGLADEGTPIDQPVLARGDHDRAGEAVRRGYVAALLPTGSAGVTTGSGRKEVAEIIASPLNPLTARVMANRVWQWVFGNGIVATPDDFGHMGEAPSHPHLLDLLAGRFAADGWSVKELLRQLVHTRAFRAAAAPSPSARQVDPANRLLSHFTPRRGEAEVIRDSLLAVSGRLDPTMGGQSVHPSRETADPEKRLFTGPLDGLGRRSLYIKFQLMEPPAFLESFNIPGGKEVQGKRETAFTPAQSLALLNDPLVQHLAARWGAILVAEGPSEPAARVDAMFLAGLSRLPAEGERERFLEFVGAVARAHGVAEEDLAGSAEVWKDAAHAIFNFQEFIIIP